MNVVAWFCLAWALAAIVGGVIIGRMAALNERLGRAEAEEEEIRTLETMFYGPSHTRSEEI